MLNVFRRLDADNFQTVLIERKEDVWPSFKALLAKDRLTEQQPPRESRMARDYDLADLEGWDARIREQVEAFGLDCYPQEFEICDHNQMLALHGVLGDAVALSALVVRQGVREAEDALRPRRLGPALRDGDQLEPGARLPDARQLAAAADPHHRARLRAQRLLQEQLHLPHAPAPSTRSAPSSRTRSACAPTRRIPASASTASRRCSTPRTRCRCSAGATWRCSKLSEDEARAAPRWTPRRRAADPFRSIHRPQEYVEPDLRKMPLVPGRGPAALHPRPQSLPRRVGEATCSPSCTRRRSTSSRRSRPRS